MGKWPVAHLRSSKCQQLPHCDIFKKCPPAAFIITNSKVKRRAISRKAQIQSTVSRKSFNFYNVRNFSRLGGKKHLKCGQKNQDETRKDTWRGEKHLEAVRLCSRWDLRQRLSHSSLWLLWFIKAPSTLTWRCRKRPHQFRIKSLAGFRWARASDGEAARPFVNQSLFHKYGRL